jgi:hypothetical protein
MSTRRNRTKSKSSRRTRSTYSKTDYESNDGMLTAVWGPGMWHFLHTMSFNYPVRPTCEEKRKYRDFILQLQYVLPCGKCRQNLKRNFRRLPLKGCHLQSRETFSKYVYDLHEVVNEMLHKKSGLSFDQVRERYEHFRARCAKPLSAPLVANKTRKRALDERGCTEPLYGEKAKCILKIVPEQTKCKTLEIDKHCVKRRLTAKRREG